MLNIENSEVEKISQPLILDLVNLRVKMNYNLCIV